MAEIRSTLDLIMEKTRNLTLSDEEKKALDLKERQGKVKGWLQRYVDGQIDLRDIEEDLAGIGKEKKIVLDLIRSEALSYIEPNEDNESILALLREIVGENTDHLSLKIDAFRKDLRLKMTELGKAAALRLEAKGIRGSAVIPNLEKDPAWQTWFAAAMVSFRKTLGIAA